MIRQGKKSILIKGGHVIDPKSELYRDLTKFKLGGRFKLAEELMADVLANLGQAYLEKTGAIESTPRH